MLDTSYISQMNSLLKLQQTGSFKHDRPIVSSIRVQLLFCFFNLGRIVALQTLLLEV